MMIRPDMTKSRFGIKAKLLLFSCVSCFHMTKSRFGIKAKLVFAD